MIMARRAVYDAHPELRATRQVQRDPGLPHVANLEAHERQGVAEPQPAEVGHGQQLYGDGDLDALFAA